MFELIASNIDNIDLLVRTPIADALSLIAERPILSFHALPIFQGASLKKSVFAPKFDRLFGRRFYNCDATITGPAFDSLFFADGAILEGEKLAARAFSADGALFVTVGTTASNQIAVTALTRRGDKVLMDKTAHQSMHFALDAIGASVTHLTPAWKCPSSHRSIWSLDDLIGKVLRAEAEGAPFDLVILNRSSYDGIALDIPAVIEEILVAGTKTRNFIIDEAWGSADYFDPATQHRCAMSLGDLPERYPDLNVVSTQSLHKSMSCIRQASMILYRGSTHLAERLRVARFRVHSTSPSYPILASIDLARAQMTIEGRELVAAARARAADFRATIATDPSLSAYRTNDGETFRSFNSLASLDTTKVSLDVSRLKISPERLQSRLFRQSSIYVNRFTEKALLLNFHIGVGDDHTHSLLEALRSLQETSERGCKLVEDARFIVPYPPGIPIHHPGEAITPAVIDAIEQYERSGIRVFAA
ncbi:hypothetical protein LQ948_18485 [Jiella sp. MQZ9-1]|uniref:Orn/Lys/Arg decarboxylases family 1 pyridoxal-P attachment site domain-containing protein n=1 Tax=Jiella flava TaxID=2816857 RepID=A0A939G3T6_9HYPH|nr:hypothetical protein [Jiella flava]MBO0664559.1 hypothetical protein [Jiella flava]MCD2473184.1 hypothetical protein [Jiella flava]